MPIVAQCPKCAKKYQVADSAAGKQVKCQVCQTAFKVAGQPQLATAGVATTGNKPPNAVVGRPTAASNAAAGSEKNSRQQQLMRQYGLQPLPRNQNQLFPEQEYSRPTGAQHPLANHVVFEPGFTYVTTADFDAQQLPQEQSMHDYMAQVEAEAREEEREGGFSMGDVTPLQIYLTIGLIPILCGVAAGIMGPAGVPKASGLVLTIGIILSAFLIRLMTLSLVKKTITPEEYSYYKYLPGYQLAICSRYWDELKHVVYAGIVLIGAALLAVAIFYTIFVLSGTSFEGTMDYIPGRRQFS